jgi:hypothetical protein
MKKAKLENGQKGTQGDGEKEVSEKRSKQIGSRREVEQEKRGASEKGEQVRKGSR